MTRRVKRIAIGEESCSVSQVKKEIKMKTKTEGILAVIAALIVLFSAMWDPRVSVAVSVVALVAFSVYKLINKND